MSERLAHELMEAAEKLQRLFQRKKAVVTIVGGGPSSAEVAGNIWQLAKGTMQNMPEIKILAGKRFMAGFPESVRSRVIRVLEKRGIRIFENGYVNKVTHETIVMDSGESIFTDFTFLASGVTPSRLFNTSGLPVGPDNGLLVNRYLQSVTYPDIFGGGDCIHFKDKPLDKVGVYAVRQNPVLLHNLFARLGGKPLQAFDPGPEYLLIFNLGANFGVLKKRGIVFSGQPAFWIKNYIDKKFMKKFQAIEKRL
ncbi:MAG: FAD-dependent oxidoreductase [Desulfobacterales bacterium]|nr:FAD-dependent oxidoreductase [Desulfobacterales bacterium]